MSLKMMAATWIAGIALMGSANAADFLLKAVKPILDVPFFQVSENRLTYSYIFNGTDPGVTGDTAKQAYSFSHFDVWAYGTNFLNISMFKRASAAFP
jgi:hypothetical protein